MFIFSTSNYMALIALFCSICGCFCASQENVEPQKSPIHAVNEIELMRNVNV